MTKRFEGKLGCYAGLKIISSTDTMPKKKEPKDMTPKERAEYLSILATFGQDIR